jgi:hypothetical protein
LAEIGHMTPIMCPACKTGKAKLVERHSDDGLAHNNKTEMWVFQCDSCGAMSVQPMDR